MDISDFETLALAQVHPKYTDKKKVGSGQARGYFVSSGIWVRLRAIQSDTSHLLYALADAIIITASDAESYFGIDPLLADGVANLIGLNTLYSAGEVTEAQRDYFLSMSVTITCPFANKTEQDFQIAKGTIQRMSVTVEKGFCTITTLEDTPAHEPQIYRRVTFSNGDHLDVRVAGFTTVQKAGVYRVQCPSDPDMYVDDAYRVLS